VIFINSNILAYSFKAYGHPNIKGTHRNTFEFTKDENLTSRGDCIIGVRATFHNRQLKEFLKQIKEKSTERITIKISISNPNSSQTISDELTAIPNFDFSDDHEFVVRLGPMATERTFATNADKSAMMLKRELIAAMKIDGAVAAIEISSLS